VRSRPRSTYIYIIRDNVRKFTRPSGPECFCTHTHILYCNRGRGSTVAGQNNNAVYITVYNTRNTCVHNHIIYYYTHAYIWHRGRNSRRDRGKGDRNDYYIIYKTAATSCTLARLQHYTPDKHYYCYYYYSTHRHVCIIVVIIKSFQRERERDDRNSPDRTLKLFGKLRNITQHTPRRHSDSPPPLSQALWWSASAQFN